MKEAYKYVAGKVIAYDDKEGMVEYDYQDNIEDLLKQENVVEQIKNDIEELKEKEKKFDKEKDSFVHLFFSEGFFDRLLICVGASGLSIFCNFLFLEGFDPLPEIVNIFFRTVAGISLASGIPVSIKGYKNAKINMYAKVENVREQIKEFEEILRKSEELKANLEKNKTKVIPEELIDKSSKNIDNSNLSTISLIEKKKQLYSFFRNYILKINDFNTIENLNDEYNLEFTEKDVRFIDDMVSKNNALSKRRAKRK